MTQTTYDGIAGADTFDASAEAAKDIAVFRNLGAGDSATGGAGNDRFAGNGDHAALMDGGAGDDQFYIAVNYRTGGSRDTIIGGGGNDTLYLMLGGSAAQDQAAMQELGRFNDYLTTTLASDPAAHFISDLLHVDFSTGGAGQLHGGVNAGGVVTSMQQVIAGPAAVADAYAAQEDVLLTVDAAHGVLANDGRSLGALIAVAGSFTTALGGSVTLAADGSFHYLGAANANGADSFSYTATDVIGRASIATASIAVAAVNDAPTVVLISAATVAENVAGAAIGTLGTTDADAGDGFTYSVSDSRFAVVGGTLALKAGQALDFEAEPSVSLTITSTDAGGLAVTQGFTIAVTNVNEAPVLANALLAQSATSGTAFSYAVAAGSFADPDAGTTLTYTATKADGSALPAWLSFNAAADRFAGTPADADIGSLSVKVTASDGSLATAGSFDIIVARAPIHVAAISLGTIAAGTGTGGFKLLGETTDDNLTKFSAMTTIGDMNGDGRPEILVGAYGNDTGGSNAGAAYVIWGKAGNAAVNLDTVALGSGGFKIYGEAASDLLSQYALTTIGDLNGDGRPEILVGSASNAAGGAYAGAAYVVWGKADGTAVNLDAVALGTGGFKIFGETGSDQLSYNALTSIGDLNGDGRPEILVGAYGNAAGGGTNTGAAYVVWGKADGTAVNLDAVALGTGGFKITGEDRLDYLSQYALTPIGDLNGDGKPEILVGAYGNAAGGNSAGAAYVVWGKADTTAINLDDVTLGTGGFKIIGENAGDWLSQTALTTIGDLNGDGRPEILVGAFQNTAGGNSAGAAYVVWGKADNTAVNLDAVALGTGGFKIIGEAAFDNLAYNALTTIGDLNGDGRPEILVGASKNDAGDSNSGAAYVVWGKADGTAVNLGDVALGTGGFKISGEMFGDQLSYNDLTTIGDLNGDGRPEILVGAYNQGAGGSTSGAAYVVWGKANGTAVNLDDVALGIGGFKIIGEAAGDNLSNTALSAISDLNGDGRPEILVGAYGNDTGGSNAGAAYIVYSSADWIGAG